MADLPAQFSMLGLGSNSQLVSNQNAAGASQQQPPSDSVQPTGDLPNSEHSRQIDPATTVQMFNGTTQDTKRAALQELRDRALHLHTNIKVIEQQQAALASQRSMMTEAMFLQRMAVAEQDITRKRAVLTKWDMMLSANGMPPIGQGIDQTNPPGVVPPQNTQGQPTWIPGTQQNSTPGFPGQSSPPPGVQQEMDGHMDAQQHNFPRVPRHNPGNAMTPPQSEPNQNNIFAPPPALPNFARASIPPLDRSRFQGSYRHFCLTKKLAINEAALNIGGKQVDLHALHGEVLGLRATDRRMSQDFWHIIGSKLGFSFGEEHASNDVAIRVATIYKQFLQQFDTIYVASFLHESQRRNAMNSQQGQPQSQNPAMPPQPPPSSGPSPAVVNQQPEPQRHPAASQHPSQQVSQGPLLGNPPHDLAQLLPYAYISATELRTHGFNEQLISYVEEKRPYLQRYIDQSRELRRRQSIEGAAGTTNNTSSLGMGLSGFPGTQPQPPQMPTQSSLAGAIPNPNALRGRPSQEQIDDAVMFVQ